GAPDSRAAPLADLPQQPVRRGGEGACRATSARSGRAGHDSRRRQGRRARGLRRRRAAADPPATAGRQTAGLRRPVQQPPRAVRPRPGVRRMNPRLAAAQALAAVLQGRASLGGSLPPLLERVETRDRGLTQELAFGAARWQPRLALLAEKLLQKPFKAADKDVEALLLVGLYQLLYTRVPAHAAIGETGGCAERLKKPWAKGLLNAVLRRAQREHEALFAALERDPVSRTAHPRWLQKRLKADWPEHWEAICAANNLHPPLILRVNRRHGSREAYLEELRAAGLAAEPCTFGADGIRLLQPCDVTTLPGFAEGRVSVQDEAAQLAA